LSKAGQRSAINNPEGAENYPSVSGFDVLWADKLRIDITVPAGAKPGAYPVTVSTTDDNGKTQSLNAVFNLKEKPAARHRMGPSRRRAISASNIRNPVYK